MEPTALEVPSIAEPGRIAVVAEEAVPDLRSWLEAQPAVGVALLQDLQRQGVKTKFAVAPVQVDGVWCLELSYTGDPPTGVPDHWHGHRVILRQLEPPSA